MLSEEGFNKAPWKRILDQEPDKLADE